jgi:hypothetical protein
MFTKTIFRINSRSFPQIIVTFFSLQLLQFFLQSLLTGFGKKFLHGFWKNLEKITKGPGRKAQVCRNCGKVAQFIYRLGFWRSFVRSFCGALGLG